MAESFASVGIRTACAGKARSGGDSKEGEMLSEARPSLLWRRSFRPFLSTRTEKDINHTPINQNLKQSTFTSKF